MLAGVNREANDGFVFSAAGVGILYMSVKSIVRSILLFLHLDVTKNIKYDRLTNLVLKRVIRNGSNCIDVGCHKGDMLELMLAFSPTGKHFAFEPIPDMFEQLQKKFAGRATLFKKALSDQNGESTFQLVKNAPAYSGLKRRQYGVANPEIEEIKVEIAVLDDLIPSDTKIDLIKIDVEGGEFGVMKGAKRLLKKNKPVMVFECGRGASDSYGLDPKELFQFITEEIGLGLHTLASFLAKAPPMTWTDFERYYRTNEEYYFVASS